MKKIVSVLWCWCVYCWPVPASPLVRLEQLRLWLVDDNRVYLSVHDNRFALSLGDGQDDRFTFGAGLDVNIALETTLVDGVEYRVFLNCYTNNAYAHLHSWEGPEDRDQFRADLFSHMLVLRRRLGPVLLFAGAEVMCVGNWGGESIQNTFHRLTGYTLVDVPYDDSRRVDVCLPFGVSLRVLDVPWANGGLGCSLYSEALLSLTPLGKSSLWTGVSFRARTGVVTAEVSAGYKAHWFTEQALYGHMYSSGAYAKVLATVAVGPLGISSGRALNAYGSQQSGAYMDGRHFFWSLSIGGTTETTTAPFYQ